MHFSHAAEIWNDFPELVPGVLSADGIRPDVAVSTRTAELEAVATLKLATQSEGELPEIRAWRRTFTRMGLKPTQYRSASESLLRRFRKQGSLPQIHPLIDLCNAASLAFAIPVAVFDVAKVADYLEVRYANGSERYESFGGEVESPESGEVIFADATGRAHARRWTNRQSAYSAVHPSTSTVVIVAEAMHNSARPDVERLLDKLADELQIIWSVDSRSAVLTSASPRSAL